MFRKTKFQRRQVSKYRLKKERSFIHTFKTFIEHLLYAWHCTKYLGYIHEENRQRSLPLWSLHPSNVGGEEGYKITMNIINMQHYKRDWGTQEKGLGCIFSTHVKVDLIEKVRLKELRELIWSIWQEERMGTDMDIYGRKKEKNLYFVYQRNKKIN